MHASEYDVYLQVYDFVWNEKIALPLNKCMRRLGLGGIYHTAIRVHGLEFDFTMDGIDINQPMSQDASFKFKKRIYLGRTDLSRDEILGVLNTTGRRCWPNTSYMIINQNCNHFTHAMAKGLGVQHTFPRWINRPARIGGKVQRLISRIRR